MLTLEEVLADAAASPGFDDAESIGVNSRGAEGQTPLHWMAVLGDAKAIRLLIEAGASIDAADHDGNTPLHEAVLCRQGFAARELVDRGADLLLKNNSGMTPLEMAMADGYAPNIELLQGAQGGQAHCPPPPK